ISEWYASVLFFFFFFLLLRPPPLSTLFPYTTLFRSSVVVFPVLGKSASVFRPPAVQRSHVQDERALFLRSAAASCRAARRMAERSEEHTSELQSRENLVCRLLLEKKKSTQ